MSQDTTPEKAADGGLPSTDLLGLKKLLWKHGIHHESLRADILQWAGNACNEIGLKHQTVEGTYSAGKKAGAFECRDIFLPNAKCAATGSERNDHE